MKTFVVALSVLAVAVSLHAAPGQVQENPEPRWRVTWKNITVTASTSLPPRPGFIRTINLAGQVHLFDLTDLAGIGHQATIDRVEDQDGKVIYENTQSRPTPPGHFQNHFSFGRDGGIPTMHISANFQIKSAFPTSLKRVVGRVQMLQKSTAREVKLPLAVNEQWTRLDDQLSIRIAEVKQDGRQLRIKIAARGLDPAMRLMRHHGGMPMSGVTVNRLVLVDDQGGETPDIEPRIEIAVQQIAPPGGNLPPQLRESLLGINVLVPQGREYEILRLDVSEAKVEPLKFELLDVQLPRIKE